MRLRDLIPQAHKQAYDTHGENPETVSGIRQQVTQHEQKEVRVVCQQSRQQSFLERNEIYNRQGKAIGLN